MSATMATIERWLGNPVTRFLLQWLSSDCSRCGNRLEVALFRFTHGGSAPCISCRMASWLVGITLRRSGKAFGVREDLMKEGLLDPYLRRGLTTVIRSIDRHGITRPQRINAPFLVVWDVTHRCNLRCIHCYQDACQALPDELDTGEAKGVIDQLARAGVVAISHSRAVNRSCAPISGS